MNMEKDHGSSKTQSRTSETKGDRRRSPGECRIAARPPIAPRVKDLQKGEGKVRGRRSRLEALGESRQSKLCSRNCRQWQTHDFSASSAVSGLNRGLAANEDDLKTAESAAKELETAVGPVDLAKDLDKLQGLWKLIYSSGFSSRSLGGSCPGPPIGRLLPITLGQVFQRIDILSKDFDNIVEVQLGAPWPLPQINATATLAHKFELIGTASIKITFEKTTIKATGNLSQLPLLEVPRLPDALRPSSNTRSGEFEVTYVDSDFRVTRGDKGELRVFVSS